jgi:hypothetical protein
LILELTNILSGTGLIICRTVRVKAKLERYFAIFLDHSEILETEINLLNSEIENLTILKSFAPP